MTGGTQPRSGAPHTEPAIGLVVRDTARDRVGVVMDYEGPYLQLRPLSGGREWDADVAHVHLLSSAELLSARVADANARSRTDLGLSSFDCPPQVGPAEEHSERPDGRCIWPHACSAFCAPCSRLA